MYPVDSLVLGQASRPSKTLPSLYMAAQCFGGQSIGRPQVMVRCIEAYVGAIEAHIVRQQKLYPV
jgi:hypothetical protein